MTHEMILDALAHCVKNDCGDCPMKGKDWTNRGLAACEAFAEGETVEMPVKLIEHVIKLLKAQKPVKPYATYSEHTGTKWLVCGACNEPMNKVRDETWSNYCPNCGRPVKWE